MTAPVLQHHRAEGVTGLALLSPCGTYRYRLDRIWQAELPCLVFVMLNPSTADAARSDPTLRACVARAAAGGFGRLRVMNLYALRAAHPAVLRTAVDPVGPGNEAAIAEGLADLGPDDRLVCAWGNIGHRDGRGAAMTLLLRRTGQALHHLGLTAAGSPRHPLYVPRCQPLVPWRDP